MGSEQALIMTHNQGDYGASEGAEENVNIGSLSGRYGPKLPPHRRAVQTVLHLPLRMFAICSLDRPRLAHATFLCSERALEHVFEVEYGRLPIPNHRTSEL
jgi:hypothetical protein